MANIKNKKITPLPEAIADAKKLIAAGKLPTHKELAKRWNCSIARVPLVLNKVRKPKSRKKVKATKVVVRRSALNTRTYPILSRISAAMQGVETQLREIEGHISAIPNLSPAETKPLLKKAHAGIWSTFHGELSNAVDAVAKLATIKRKRRARRKVAVKKAVVGAVTVAPKKKMGRPTKKA